MIRALRSPVQSVAFSADSKWIFTSSAKGRFNAFSLDGKTCYSAALPSDVAISEVRFPSSRYPGLAIGIDNSIWRFSFNEGIELAPLPPPSALPNSDIGAQTESISAHGDEVFLADSSTSGWFSIAGGRRAKLFERRFSPASPDIGRFSPDSTLIGIATSDGMIHVFHAKSGAELLRPSKHRSKKLLGGLLILLSLATIRNWLRLPIQARCASGRLRRGL
jgi:WD40 repeat protein